MDEQSSRELTGKSILNAAFRVHSELGPGLLECVYESALAFELASIGQSVERQKPIPVSFRSVVLSDVGFRADMIVNSLVLVELKSVQQITDLHKKTTWNYLRLIPLPLGFLINFNQIRLMNGITRITNGAEGKTYFSLTQAELGREI